MARVNAYLHKPVEPDMFWDELLLWHDEARQIHSESFGLLHAVFGGARP